MKAETITTNSHKQTITFARPTFNASPRNGKSSASGMSVLNAIVHTGTFLLLVGAAFLVFELKDEFSNFNSERLRSTSGMVFI
ncbi:MAG: hypothetical protein EOP06_27770, partial [Proteobacteria bacterium]